MTDQARIFSVSNKHVAATDSGKPPHVDGDTRGRYHGYFENEYSEQAVYLRYLNRFDANADFEYALQFIDAAIVSVYDSV